MNIIIGADLVPTKSNTELFAAGDIRSLLGDELCGIIKGASYRIFNLETPFTDIETPIEKAGPALRARTDTVNGYVAMGCNLLTLANNHILDQGQQGLKSTCDVLKRKHIDYVGVGATPKEAALPYIFEFAGKKVGVYACAEHEFSIVSECEPGANPFEPLESLDDINSLKKQCDFVIVLYHGGKEHYRYPSPYLQKVCHRMIDKGADLVICQHSHCIGCEEHYNSGIIVYGQGNFLFDHSDDECWKTSLLVSLDEKLEISYIPLVKAGNAVRIADREKKAEILEGFKKRSHEIKQKGFVEERYRQFAQEMFMTQLLPLTGRESFLFRAVNRVCFNKLREMKLKWRYGKESMIVIRNFIECEAHRELLLKGLEVSYERK